MYVNQTAGAGKYVGAENNVLGIKLLAFGRYFLQVIFPAWPCVSNGYPGSPRNLAGLALFPVFVALLRKRGGKESGYWLLYFLLPLAPVTLRLTNVFVTDTYLPNASAGVLIAALYLIKKSFPKPRARIRTAGKVAAGTIIILFFGQSLGIAHAWESERKLWEYSYLTEATPTNTVTFGLELLKEHHWEDALRLALQAYDWNPDQVHLPLLLAQAVYKFPGWDLEKKISTLEKNRLASPWFSYYLAALYAAQDRWAQAYAEMRPSLGNIGILTRQLQENLEIVVAETALFCIRSGAKDCDSLGSDVAKRLQANPWLRLNPWNERLYEEHLKGVKRTWGSI
jgi:hypothetical protein